MTVYWIRHGETTAPDDRCVGHEDVLLSEEGRHAIDQLGTTWTGPPPDRVLSSDLARARESAKILADGWGLSVHSTEQLRELDFGGWTGRTWDAIEAEDGERLHTWMDNWVETAPPGGEAFEALSYRVVDWLGDAQDAEAGTIMVVAHAGPIRAALCHALGLPLDRAFRLQVDCASVSALTTGRTDWTVVCFNSTRFRRPDPP